MVSWQRLHRQVSEFVERLQATLSAENLDWEEWQSELQHRQRYLRYHEQNLQHTLKGGEKSGGNILTMAFVRYLTAKRAGFGVA